MRDPSPQLRCIAAWFVAAAAFALANLGHLSNPGWFSHDELQWGWRAQEGHGVDWLDNRVFQYRPLTFQLWVWIARVVFDTPVAYHALWVALGFGVCALLYAVLRRGGASVAVACLGAAAFGVNPYAMYVHGWVATLAELIWTACALGIAWYALGRRESAQSRRIVLVAFGLTSVALLAKETALAIAPLAALAWWLTRQRRWRAVLVGALVPTMIYLAMRLPTLLFADRPDGAYAWSLAHLPQRWVEFQVWPLVPTALEITSLAFSSPTRLAICATLAALLLAAVLRTDRRLGLWLLAGGAVALGPAVVLETGYPQYGYAASALAWGCIAWAWPAMRLPWRGIVAVGFIANLWHGIVVQRDMLHVGRIESVFTREVRPLLRVIGPDLVLVPDVAADEWIYRRLAQALPDARRGVQVRVAGEGLRITPDGHVRD